MSTQLSPSSPLPSFLDGGREAARLIRDKDWSAHPLGPPETWPEGLQTALSLVLNSPESMILAWGPDLHFFFNETYFPLLGPRLSWAMGARFDEVWADGWDQAKPIIDEAMAGRPERFVNLPWKLATDRGAEDTWWTFSYSRVLDRDGGPAGLFIFTNETTEAVVGEAARIASDTRNRQIIDSAAECAIIATDLDGVITRWSEGAGQILGWTEAEMLGQPIGRIFTPEDLAEDRPKVEMRCALETGHGADQRWHVRKDGERFWANGEMTPLRDAGGMLAGFVKVLRDRTEQRRAGEALRESEAVARENVERVQLALAAGAIIGTWTWDIRTDQFRVDEPFARAFGLDPALGREGLALEQIVATVHPDDQAGLADAIAAAIERGGAYAHQYRVRRADGKFYWIEANGRVEHAPDGTPTTFPGVLLDIESRRAIEGERDRAVSKLRELNDTLEQQVAERTSERDRAWRVSQDLLVVIRPDGTFVRVNPSWKTLLGWQEDEMVGRTFMEFAHPDELATSLEVLATILQRPLTEGHPSRFRHKDGSYRWFSWTAAFEDGLVYASGRDTTLEREQAEQLVQSQKMEAVGQLTGGLAHDFNNLLTAVTGGLELLGHRLGAGRTDGLDRYINMAQSGAQRAAALTQRLLAFSRRQTLSPTAVDVDRLIAGMEEIVARTIGPAIELHTSATAGLWPVMADASQLENALLNLCINARDAMPDGGHIAIETRNCTVDQHDSAIEGLAAGDYVGLCVSDTGTGMSPDTISRIFEPFYTTKPIGEGTGLGLSMIYGFARQSGGEIRVQSELGRGTTMCIYLPRYVGDRANSSSKCEAQSEVELAEGETILVVEDEEAIRELLNEVLSEAGYRVLEAPNGPSGVQVLSSDERIDLLITDVGLPGGLNGRQVADAGRKIRPQLKVMFVTGYAANAAVGGENMAKGMEVMTKPFNTLELARKVRDLISRQM